MSAMFQFGDRLAAPHVPWHGRSRFAESEAIGGSLGDDGRQAFDGEVFVKPRDVNYKEDWVRMWQ